MCINIVYFPLGHGTDYVYRGKTEFRGIHNGDILELSPFKLQPINAETVSDLYPEYYILKVNGFNKVATTPLEEWIYYLNTGKVPDFATASGLAQVREQLKLDSMSKKGKRPSLLVAVVLKSGILHCLEANSRDKNISMTKLL